MTLLTLLLGSLRVITLTLKVVSPVRIIGANELLIRLFVILSFAAMTFM